MSLVIVIIILTVSIILLSNRQKFPEIEHKWEVVPAYVDGELVGYQIRWSEPDDKGRYLWVGHYFAGEDITLNWCEVAAESHCRRLIEQNKLPVEYR